MTAPLTAPMLERRRIEAEILGLMYKTLVAEFDEETAKRLIARTVHQSAITQGKALADALEGPTSLQSFVDILHLWTAGGTLETEVVRQDDEVFEFRVTRCRYSEMYKDMGLSDLGGILSCHRDGTMCEGYDTNLKMTRTQTIMEGASHCDFRFDYSKSGNQNG
jgi:hypothetical protein